MHSLPCCKGIPQHVMIFCPLHLAISDQPEQNYAKSADTVICISICDFVDTSRIRFVQKVKKADNDTCLSIISPHDYIKIYSYNVGKITEQKQRKYIKNSDKCSQLVSKIENTLYSLCISLFSGSMILQHLQTYFTIQGM